MYDKESKKRVLIKLINYYLTKEHIQSRYLFKFYRDNLLNDKYLTERQFRHLSKYIVHDLKMTTDQVRSTFEELVQNNRQPHYERNDLTPFMI